MKDNENKSRDNSFEDISSGKKSFDSELDEFDAVSFEENNYDLNFDEVNLNSADGGENSIDLNSFSTHYKSTSSDGKKSGNGKKKGKSTAKSKVLKVVLSLFLIGVITCSLLVGSIVVYAFAFVDSSMVEDLNELSTGFTTTIYTSDGEGGWNEYQRLYGEFNRIWVPYENMPENLINAYVAIEDRRFYDHQGIDWKRTVSAFANLFFHFYSSNQGGSTITQQLVKNLTGDNSTSPMRKVREIMRARELESNYSKDTIVECYLNTISMAGGMYGSEVASNYYFGKSTKDLTLTECAALAAIAKAPETYRPDKCPENNKRRRNLVLTEMLNQGKISQEEYDKSTNEELEVVADESVKQQTEINSWFTDAIIEEVINDLSEKYDYDKTYASKNFYNGGYKIYATMDPHVQEAIDSTVGDKSYVTKSAKGQISQTSITVMDYEGHVLGLAGGLGEKTANRGFNRATQGTNQAGSTMKPMGAYALSIENNNITYSSAVVDEKVTYGSWSPKNWYHSYLGKIKVNTALERSVNIIPIKLVDELTPEKSYEFCTQKLGLYTLDNNDINLASLAIGGNSKGITTMESAGAYSVFGAGGKFYKPTTYYRVENQHGKVILEGESEPVVAIGEDSATIMNHLLQGVVYGSNGTAKGVENYCNGSRVYGKTGTSDSSNDSWFVGGTPYYIASCWYGFDQDERISATGNAKRIWGNVMKKLHADKEAKDFTDSDYVTKRYYCSSTGLCANSNCPSGGVGWYKKTYMPACTTHGGKIRDEAGENVSGYPSKSTSSTSSATQSQTTPATPPAETPPAQPTVDPTPQTPQTPPQTEQPQQ